MHIHSRSLLNFEEIRKAGSIREAARRLHLSSSALNRQLLELESEIGRPLFERLPGGLKVTPEGKVLSQHVITLIQDAQRMEGELGALRGVSQGAVDVLTVESLTSDFIPQILQGMKSAHPGIDLTVRTTTSSDAVKQVTQGLSDIAICFARHTGPDVHPVSVARFELGAAVAPFHDLASYRNVSLEECLTHPLVLPTEEISIFEEIGPLISARESSIEVFLRTDSFELMRKLAIQGKCVALVNRFGIENELLEKKLVFVPLSVPLSFKLGIYTRSHRVLPHAVDAFALIAAAELTRRRELDLDDRRRP
ncbi:LysR family transcriptional regulator [Cupriavidus sp. IK-TO18]|uniref:LysR family transcriptional regulator n=1 Tax=Cupriavidus sp. IK-TO18 TaxID=2782182 RepID=UPI002105F1AE|nr:LysR family transcriptional regulator [Cupriavidus sp. IK-TO18]